MKAAEMLSCGHLSTPKDWGNGSGLPGYVRRATDDSRICYACADAEQVAELKTGDTFTAYLSSDGQQLTTWTGGKLARIVRLTHGRHNIGGKLYRFRAVDVHGVLWYGTSPGPGMYARMHRAKRQK